MRWTGLIFFLLGCTPLLAQYKNVRLAGEADGQSLPLDPTIVIDTKDTKTVVVGIGPNRAVHSHDGGISWSESVLDSPAGMGGEPSLVADFKGHLYYFHASDPAKGGPKSDAWLDQVVCQKSVDGGKSWTPGTFTGQNSPKDERYAWPTVHPRRTNLYVTWTQFDSYGSTDVNCHTNIMYSMSTNAGSKWAKPVQISQTPGNCADDDKTAHGAAPAVSQDGRIYVTWANQGFIFFDRSYDGGEMWLSNDVGIAKQQAGWSMKVPGYKRTSGRPVIAIDNSDDRKHGGLYVVYADQPSGENDTDIFFIRSTNRGDTWTKPVRINADSPGKHQFMPWIAVDQVTSNIFIVYYDRRDYDDLQTDVYLAYSLDAGNNFKEIKISETSFVPTETNTSNQQIGIAAHDGVVIPVWTRMDDGKASVWTTVINADLLKK